jgi:hypothetical protein
MRTIITTQTGSVSKAPVRYYPFERRMAYFASWSILIVVAMLCLPSLGMADKLDELKIVRCGTTGCSTLVDSFLPFDFFDTTSFDNGGATITSFTLVDTNFTETTGALSDVVSVDRDPLVPTFYAVTACSDFETPLTCPPPSAFTRPEDGLLDTVALITWSDGKKDTVSFASDVERTRAPEPATLLLLLSGLAGLGIRRQR